MLKISETRQEVFRVSTFCVVLINRKLMSIYQRFQPQNHLYIPLTRLNNLHCFFCWYVSLLTEGGAASEAAGLAEPHPRNSTELALTYTYLQNSHSHG